MNPVSWALEAPKAELSRRVHSNGGRKPMMVPAWLLVRLEWERVGDPAAKGDQLAHGRCWMPT